MTVDCCILFVVVCRVMFDVCDNCCVLFVVRCRLLVEFCLLLLDSRLVSGVYCLLFVVCMVFVVCCLLVIVVLAVA